MKRIANVFSNWPISALFVICLIKCSYSVSPPNRTGLHGFDFEQIKRNLFMRSESNKLSDDILAENDECLTELFEIGDGLQNFDKWAIRSINILLFTIS